MLEQTRDSTAGDRQRLAERLAQLVALRSVAEVLREEYRGVYRDRALLYAERLTALGIVTGQMRAILTESLQLVYGPP